MNLVDEPCHPKPAFTSLEYTPCTILNEPAVQVVVDVGIQHATTDK